MANVNIKPENVLLTSGQAVTFEATDAAGAAVSVNWSLKPLIGSLPTPPEDKLGFSATYSAPPLVASAQTVAVIASDGNGSASATISLTPDAITIIPAKVDLVAGQEQPFIAIVAGAPVAIAAAAPANPAVPPPASTAQVPQSNVTWILSPPLGEFHDTGLSSGLYRAPAQIEASTMVTVTYSSPTTGRQTFASINLTAPPWTGLGVTLLGTFIFLVFALVFFMVLLWPPALPAPDAAKASRIEAEKTLEEKTGALEKVDSDLAKARATLAKLKAAGNKLPSSATPTAGAPPTEQNAISPDQAEAQANVDAAEHVDQRAMEAWDFADKDLKKKRDVEEMVNDTGIDTKLAGRINRELDLLWLVLLAGALGSFLHMAQSYTDYIGNRTLKSNWAWWYYFRPFIGAVLALIFYASMRGGFIAIATGSNARASELNPFGLVAIAALVGMFSRAATMKLGEVFDTLFKSDKAKETSDKLVQSPGTSSSPAGATPAGGATDSAAAK